jgi:hypothetical protein
VERNIQSPSRRIAKCLPIILPAGEAVSLTSTVGSSRARYQARKGAPARILCQVERSPLPWISRLARLIRQARRKASLPYPVSCISA